MLPLGVVNSLQVLAGNARQQKCITALLSVLGRHQQQQHIGDLRTEGTLLSSSRGVVTAHTHIPRKQHDQYKTPPQNYVQLLQHIAHSRDIPALARLVQHYGRNFDAVHVAAAVAMVPKLYQPPAPGGHLNTKQLKERKRDAARLMTQLQESAVPLVPRMFAGQVAAITYALSRSSSLLHNESPVNTTTQRLLGSMLTRVTQDEARLLWQGANGTSLTNLLHGIARLGYSTGSEDGSAAKAAANATKHLCKIIARDCDRLHVRQLATAAWSLARISKKHPALLRASCTIHALDAISKAVVSRKLYLRPESMTGLLTAAAWLHRRDKALLEAVAEEALHQLPALRPPHLAVFAWAYPSLRMRPPPDLIAGLVAQSRRQLSHFSAYSLGLLLQGLRELQALDKTLLAEVAAGIAAEQEVALSPADAVRILGAFVAVPDAGSARDVEGMAQRVAGAIRRSARDATPSVITELVHIYSLLPSRHQMLERLLLEVRDWHEQGAAWSLRLWAKLLAACGRLGYGGVLADPVLEGRVSGLYKAGEAQLVRYLTTAVLQQGGEELSKADKQQQQQDQSIYGKVASAFRQQQTTQPTQQEQQGEPAGSAAQPQQQPARLPPLMLDYVMQTAQLLARRQPLSRSTAELLAQAGLQLLPVLSMQQLMQLLGALTGRDGVLAGEQVVALFTAAVDQLSGLDISSSPKFTTAVLVGLLGPLSSAVPNLDKSSEAAKALVSRLHEELLPVLQECDEGQLVSVWQAMARSGLRSEALAARAKDLALCNGWVLSSSGLHMG